MNVRIGISRTFFSIRGLWRRGWNRLDLSGLNERQLADMGLSPHLRLRLAPQVHEPTQRWLDGLP